MLKPAPEPPLVRSGSRELAAQTDLPPGVLNIVTSSDHAVGAMLTSDPRVDMGVVHRIHRDRRAVMAAAPTVKKVFLARR